MKDISPTQQLILDFLLESRSGKSADELVEVTAITKTAVKAHLDTLLNRGLLRFEDENMGVGRPRRKYYLSDEATEIFPKQYSWLSTQLLKELSHTLDRKEIQKFMRRLADRVFNENQKDLSHSDQNERLKKLADLMNALGYKAHLRKNKREGKTFIEAYNCVYHGVAKDHPELCEFDRQLISRASQMETTLEECIAKGGGSCRFCLCASE